MFMRYVGGGVGHRNQTHAEAYEDEVDENDEINVEQGRDQEGQRGTDDKDKDKDKDEDNYQHDGEDGEEEGNGEGWEGEGGDYDGYNDYGYGCL